MLVREDMAVGAVKRGGAGLWETVVAADGCVCRLDDDGLRAQQWTINTDSQSTTVHVRCLLCRGGVLWWLTLPVELCDEMNQSGVGELGGSWENGSLPEDFIMYPIGFCGYNEQEACFC